MIDFANGKVKIDKNRQRILLENTELNPAIARPYFGNLDIADIVILQKQPANDFKMYNHKLPDSVDIAYRNMNFLHIQGKLKINGQEIFIPSIDTHRVFM